jgi:hypothetical protein
VPAGFLLLTIDDIEHQLGGIEGRQSIGGPHANSPTSQRGWHLQFFRSRPARSRFDKLKDEHQSPEQREALASRLLANYLAGIRDEAELLSTSKLPLGR